MPKKKDRKSEELSEQEKLNHRVDVMMDPKLPDPPADKHGAVPPLDIFKDAPAEVAKAAKTAPEVSGKLLNEVDEDEKETAPQPSRQPEPHNDLPKDPVSQADPLDDADTDSAVSDIAAKEGNTLLALQDAIGLKASHVAGTLAEEDRRKARRRHRAWFVFLVLFATLVLLALPLNAYTCRWPVGLRLSVTTDILPSVCK